jgi:hypothetical protein
MSAPALEGIPPRFVIERPIAAGGFGAVYVAWDSERETRVALKRLVRREPSAVYRFRQEFRALAGLEHPNLVRLHELFAVEDELCFTMDLVPGVPFDRFVRGEGAESGLEAPTTAALGDGAADGPAQATQGSTVLADAAAPLPFHEGRLRSAVRGLVAGVLALHEASILHRDLKPSNVLVRADGRTVILDFGLAATGVIDTHASLELLGTPAYMSPEQALAHPLSPASDWYAVGVMLYEALCGQLPFAGTPGDLLAARVQREARDPRTRRRALPADLCELCMALLRREPAARPTGAEIAARLELGKAAVTPRAPRAPFVGRERELAALREALGQAEAGRPVVVDVRGPSGVGKSALVRRFLEELQGASDALVLEGRCYEREYVPYKAFDDILDELARKLQRMPDVEAAALLPRDVRTLARLFPSLARLPVLGAVGGRPPALDAHELRRLAFAALRELLSRLSDRAPVVLFIDDAQWADADSAALLFELLRPPEPPRLLLVVADRGGREAGGGDLLRLLTVERPEGAGHHLARVDLEPLAMEEAVALAGALIDPEAAQAGRAVAIARESNGSPLFVEELARAVAHPEWPAGQVSLQALLAARVRELDPPARTTLAVLACAVRPLPEEILRRAATLGPREGHQAMDRLRQGSLLHTAQLRGRPLAEVPHDRVRAAALEVAGPDECRRLTLRLAETLEETGESDPETLAQLFAAAGERRRAAVYAERAGDRASTALAFEQAATLYLKALEGAAEPDRLRALIKLADALAQAGRGRDAAMMYVEAARLTADDEGSLLRERAAIQLLRSGHTEAGLDVLGPVAGALDMTVPPTPTRALGALLYHRARLKLRRTDFVERRAEELAPEVLRRIDLCWALGNGLVGVDLVRSAGYQARHLLLALEAGEPYRIARALAFEAILSALENRAGIARAERLLARAQHIARAVDHPHALAWTVAAAAIKEWAECRFTACAELCDQAAKLFHERCTDIFREVGSLEVWFSMHVRFLLGRLEEVALRASTCVREAEARGDLYTLTTARAYTLPGLWLAQGRAAEARREALEAVAQWGESAWHHQHWAALRAQCHVDLYEGAGARAMERISASRPAMKRALQLRLRALRVEATYLEGRGALEAALVGPGGRAALLATAERAAAALAREDSRWASAHGQALRAARAALTDDRRREEAPALFARAGAAYAELEMPLFSAACAWRRGELLGGDEGSAARAEAERRLRAAGVRDPAPFAAFLVPRVQP